MAPDGSSLATRSARTSWPRRRKPTRDRGPADRSRGPDSLVVDACPTLAGWHDDRRERIDAARHAAVRNSLIGDGLSPETAYAWIAAWEAQAAKHGLEDAWAAVPDGTRTGLTALWCHLVDCGLAKVPDSRLAPAIKAPEMKKAIAANGAKTVIALGTLPTTTSARREF